MNSTVLYLDRLVFYYFIHYIYSIKDQKNEMNLINQIIADELAL